METPTSLTKFPGFKGQFKPYLYLPLPRIVSVNLPLLIGHVPPLSLSSGDAQSWKEKLTPYLPDQRVNGSTNLLT